VLLKLMLLFGIYPFRTWQHIFGFHDVHSNSTFSFSASMMDTKKTRVVLVLNTVVLVLNIVLKTMCCTYNNSPFSLTI
jgi:hypothetical protein